MDKKGSASINLLPISYKEFQKRESKFYKIQNISISLLLFLIFVTSITIALRIIQAQQINAAEGLLEQNNQKVSDLKPREASLFLLKDRLTNIDQITSLPSKQRSIYNLVSQLIPANLNLNFVSVDTNGDMLISIVAPNFASLDELLIVLTSKDKNEDSIAAVSLESFSRSRDGLYRASIKIKPR